MTDCITTVDLACSDLCPFGYTIYNLPPSENEPFERSTYFQEPGCARKAHCIDGPFSVIQLPDGTSTSFLWGLFGRMYLSREEWELAVLGLKRAVLFFELRRTIQLTWRRSRPMMQAFWAPEGKGGKKHKAQMEAMITGLEVASQFIDAMAWSGTVNHVGRLPSLPDGELVCVSLGAELGDRQVVTGAGCYRMGERLVFVENGILGQFCPDESRRGLVVTPGDYDGYYSQGVVVRWEGMQLPPEDGINVNTLVGFVEDPAYRLTREFMAAHRGEKMLVVVYPTGAKRFEVEEPYTGDDPLLRKLAERMIHPKRRWTRLWGWDVGDGRGIIEGGDDIPWNDIIDFVLEFYEDLRAVHIIRPRGELAPVERSYRGLAKAVHRKMKMMGQRPPYNLTMKITAETEGALEVPVDDSLSNQNSSS